MSREEYVPPVGFAHEPSETRRRWFARIALALLMAGLAWLFIYRVWNPPEDNPGVPVTSTLPGPV